MSDTTPVTTPTAPAGPTLSEKIVTIGSAWETIAPETKYAAMTLPEYRTVVAPYVAGQAAVLLGKQSRAATVVNKNLADAATQLVLNQTISSIKGSQEYGPNCALYRACGYIASSERASGAKKAATDATVATVATTKTSMAMIDRLSLVTAAWTFLAPETKFAGRTLAEFVTATTASHLARATLETANAVNRGAIQDRNVAGKIARLSNQKVVASVIAADGKTSAIYHAMGYKNIG